jgi:hypothetical protein
VGLGVAGVGTPSGGGERSANIHKTSAALIVSDTTARNFHFMIIEFSCLLGPGVPCVMTEQLQVGNMDEEPAARGALARMDVGGSFGQARLEQAGRSGSANGRKNENVVEFNGHMR